jgi:hypothetical protein
MGRAIAVISGSAATLVCRPLHQIGNFFASVWQEATRDIARPYKPERYYMRGPGPKWREKHGQIEPR